MNEYEVLQLFIEEIESVTDFPVRMSQHDEDHEPEMVLLDNLNVRRQLRSTNPYIGLERDGGSVIGERHQFYYDARLDITVQSESEDLAYQTRMEIAEHFRPYEKRPKALNEDLVIFELGSGGQREAEFEPSVFRLFKQNQTFQFEYADETVVTQEALEEIEDNL